MLLNNWLSCSYRLSNRCIQNDKFGTDGIGSALSGWNRREGGPGKSFVDSIVKHTELLRSWLSGLQQCNG